MIFLFCRSVSRAKENNATTSILLFATTSISLFAQFVDACVPQGGSDQHSDASLSSRGGCQSYAAGADGFGQFISEHDEAGNDRLEGFLQSCGWDIQEGQFGYAKGSVKKKVESGDVCGGCTQLRFVVSLIFFSGNACEWSMCKPMLHIARWLTKC